MLGREYSVYLNVINKSDNPLPVRATEGSSGFDLRANLSEPVTLEPFQRSLIPTGLHFNLPKGFEIQIRPRSGLAAKHGITVLNTPGTIDTDYTGEIKVILINLGSESFTINHGDRIAQAVFGSNMIANHLGFKEVSDFDNQTERGENGFGSTGIKE